MRAGFALWLAAVASSAPRGAIIRAEPEVCTEGSQKEGCDGSSFLQRVAMRQEKAAMSAASGRGSAAFGFVGIEAQRWKQALAEEEKEEVPPSQFLAVNVSEFGRAVPKFPRSIVAKLLEIRNETRKRYTYNFMGRLRGQPTRRFGYGFDELKRRAWIVPFVLHNFSDHDYLKLSDASDYFKKSMGRYDRSWDNVSDAEHVGNSTSEKNKSLFDLPYYTILAASNFTLCPGGDTAWSMRAYEVALMGSICLITDPAEDWLPSDSRAYNTAGKRHIDRLFSMYRYQLLSDSHHVYDQDLADHNLRVFIKYQTFMEGDNVPPPLESFDA